jgi:hypothetical protein
MPSSEQGYRLTVKSLLLDANGKFQVIGDS